MNKINRVSSIEHLGSKFESKKEIFDEAEFQILQNFMGRKPDHFPEAKFALVYDQNNIYLKFIVSDNYIISVVEDHMGKVWQDSCVEFFFTPGNNISIGYFNLEINCGGKIYFQFKNGRTDKKTSVKLKDIQKVKVFHSMPEIVFPELQTPTQWTIELMLPLEILANYTNITKPKAGVEWRANFQKCADNSSHPHWLTWNKIDNPTPNFHLPEYFGKIIFE